MSARERKVLCDRFGQPVATLTNKLLTMHDTIEIHGPDGRRLLAAVKKQLVSLTHGAKVTVTGFPHPLEVKGDFRGKNFQVRHGHHVIARVQRKSLMKDMVRFFTGNDNYTLTVAPNVDTAFMVALAVAFDTMFHVDPK
ncbi:hypothetical protein CVIRNUC_011087 [Coccomyxa viridis]|uniref:Uncharacterized protein n=1 Tax=Coccomyxa viridis TaxID=1274662 RepID=A0AAV1IP01_9CHLO|nr:hypothetical protein CVIRNUC_011087 [Coccomyxa viridis]